jgi:hypothetical protein
MEIERGKPFPARESQHSRPPPAIPSVDNDKVHGDWVTIDTRILLITGWKPWTQELAGGL